MRDLDPYLERIAFGGAVSANIDTLRALHYHHALAIPFENLSSLLDEPVSIDPAAVADKLITRGRGGYCFEHNTLFQTVLGQIGFDVTALAARVVWGAASGHLNPRTHMVLALTVDGAQWLVDVGFGGATLTAPLRLQPDLEQATPHETFRITRQDREFELQVMWAGGWRAMYRFDLQPQLPIDFEPLNHYVASHPRSHFRRILMAGRALTDKRVALQNGRFTQLRHGELLSTDNCATVDELVGVLGRDFGIETGGIPGLEARLADIVSGVAERSQI